MNLNIKNLNENVSLDKVPNTHSQLKDSFKLNFNNNKLPGLNLELLVRFFYFRKIIFMKIHQIRIINVLKNFH